MVNSNGDKTKIVLVLVSILIVLIVLLIFLYKKLNKEANGQYTIRRLVFMEGGLRDRVRAAALVVGASLGVQLWPRSDTDEAGEEMQDIHDEEGQVEEGGSQGSDSEGDDQDDEEESEDNVGQSGETKDDTSDDDSSSEASEASEADEKDRLVDQAETKEEVVEKVVDGEGKSEASGGTGLLIDLKQFSGSAIWSEEAGGEGKESNVTAL